MGGAGSDTLDGGQGFDTASYANLNDANGYVLSYDSIQGTVVVQGRGTNAAYTETDTAHGIEKLLRGTSANDRLVDMQAGSNSWFDGGLGNDTIVGNVTDVDFVNYGGRDSTFTVNADLGAGAVTLVKNAIVVESDTLIDIRGIWGGSGNDSLVGGSNQYFRGNAGNDTIDGGAGLDVADYILNFTNQGISVTLNAVGDTQVFDQAGASTRCATWRGFQGRPTPMC